MKKLYILALFSIILTVSAQAVTVVINQTNNSFAPIAVNVSVGDVIQWNWSSGTHTTTSVSVPAGADTWDEPLDSDNTSFEYTVMVAGIYGYVCTFHSPTMGGGFQATAASVSENAANLVSDFTAGVDFNSHTLHIRIENYSSSEAVLKLMDITGRETSILFDAQLGTGEQSLHFDVANRNSGIYFVRLEQNGRVITRKVLLN